MIIQSEKQKATSRYSSYSLFVKFYLLSLFFNNCCIAIGAMIILKINSDPDKGTKARKAAAWNRLK
jgi:hypothetical protein